MVADTTACDILKGCPLLEMADFSGTLLSDASLDALVLVCCRFMLPFVLFSLSFFAG